MPPHCDSLDGPVVTAAREALTAIDVDLVTPFVPVSGEAEVRDAFERAVKARALGGEAVGVAEQWFFETVVRLHRAGEGAPYTGLRPAGADVGPVIPAAERALVSGSPDELVDLLSSEVREQVGRRLARAHRLRKDADGVASTRAYVEAALGLQVWAHSVHRQLVGDAHTEVEGQHHH